MLWVLKIWQKILILLNLWRRLKQSKPTYLQWIYASRLKLLLLHTYKFSCQAVLSCSFLPLFPTHQLVVESCSRKEESLARIGPSHISLGHAQNKREHHLSPPCVDLIKAWNKQLYVSVSGFLSSANSYSERFYWKKTRVTHFIIAFKLHSCL